MERSLRRILGLILSTTMLLHAVVDSQPSVDNQTAILASAVPRPTADNQTKVDSADDAVAVPSGANQTALQQSAVPFSNATLTNSTAAISAALPLNDNQTAAQGPEASKVNSTIVESASPSTGKALVPGDIQIATRLSAVPSPSDNLTVADSPVASIVTGVAPASDSNQTAVPSSTVPPDNLTLATAAPTLATLAAHLLSENDTAQEPAPTLPANSTAIDLVRFHPAAVMGVVEPPRDNQTLQNIPSAAVPVVNSTAADSSTAPVCSTLACQAVAMSITSSMDSSYNPCDDFFRYACQKWNESHPLPNGQNSISSFSLMSDSIAQEKHILLEIENPKASPVEYKARMLYQQCRQQATADVQQGPQPVLDIQRDVLGGWPLLTANWSSDHFDFSEAVLAMKRLGIEPIVWIDVDEDIQSSGRNIALVREAVLYSTQDVLNGSAGNQTTEKYLNKVRDLTALLLRDSNSTQTVDNVTEDLSQVVRFERTIAMGGMSRLARGSLDRFANKVNFTTFAPNGTFQSDFFKRFLDFLNQTFRRARVDYSMDNETVFVSASPSYLETLDAELARLDGEGESGKRTLAKYLGLKILYFYASRLSVEYQSTKSGRPVSKVNDWIKTCSDGVTKAMPLAVSAIYARQLSPDTIQQVSRLVDDIKVGMGQLINDAVWMDNSTRERAQNKLDRMLFLVGFPKVLMDNMSLIAEKYANVKIQSTYFGSMQSVDVNKNAVKMSLILENNTRDNPYDPDDVTVPNAQQITDRNYLAMFASLFHQPFFYAQKELALINYARLGMFIGHEMSHGFDGKGRKFDEEGRAADWWSKFSALAFDIRKRTLVDQYDALVFPAGQINGEITLNENIADNGGMKASYKAYKNFFGNASNIPYRLPGLTNFTSDQLFFLAAAQSYCGNLRMDYLKIYLLTVDHSPLWARITGPFQNMPEFAAAYSCPSGSFMNPRIKAGVW